MTLKSRYKNDYNLVYNSVLPLIRMAGVSSVNVATGLDYPAQMIIGGITFNKTNNGNMSAVQFDKIENITFE